MYGDEMGYVRAATAALLGEARQSRLRPMIAAWHTAYRAVLPALATLVGGAWDELVGATHHTRLHEIGCTCARMLWPC